MSSHSKRQHSLFENCLTANCEPYLSYNLPLINNVIKENAHSHSRDFEAFVRACTVLVLGLIWLLLDDDSLGFLAVQIGQCSSFQPAEYDMGGSKQKGNPKLKENTSKEKGKSSSHQSLVKGSHQLMSLSRAIQKSQIICQRKKDELGSPGLVVCVSVDGKQVYAEGFGYADLENETPIHPGSVLRIASISKSFTAVIVAKLWEDGKIDLHKTVQSYIPEFPEKRFKDEKVDITVSHLLNHTSGIRHYKQKKDPVYAFDKPIIKLVETAKDASLSPFYAVGPVAKKSQQIHNSELKTLYGNLEITSEKEVYMKESFSTAAEALRLFKNDPLLCKPGTRFVYTTHGYTLLSAIVESITHKPFAETVTKTFHEMGLKESYLDKNDPIIYNRARFYMKDKMGRVVNVPYVDNSYKWAGGGLLSTVEDLVKFGNILLYSAQHEDGDPGPPGYLKASTVWKFWSPAADQVTPRYGLGFELTPDEPHYGFCGHHTFGAGHTGNAVGASSMLFVLPRASTEAIDTNHLHSKGNDCDAELPSMKLKCGASLQNKQNGLPQGVVVSVVVNVPGINLRPIANDIARLFENVDFSLR
ncbi:serine beta-lactamase-like protein lactb, mitochondrial [Plakobranchus ocellatus]|uniref:Serine beta-lactamase-like protein lactb, mitochondrial n=1 Tax=Plakobranchus ocellatus TaxID=259542 RepID=A0AAV4AUS5_9GAST|nr:serine beta-lactamase-like protein lactb, mitochondrial [Plakobranchus ocellatus]